MRLTDKLLDVVGGKFSHLTSKDIVLILLYQIEKEHFKGRMSVDFVHALIYYIKKEGIPFDYKFTNGEGVYSQELEKDLDELQRFDYIEFKDTVEDNKRIKVVTLTTKGKTQAEVLLTASVPTKDEKIIKRSISPIKQLFI